jgi:allophanate hydrolase
VVPACRTLDTVSVFARTLADAHAALSVMAGEDRADPFSRRLALRPPFAPDTVRLGVPDAADRVFADGAAAQAFAATLDALPALGITPVPVDFAPFHEVAALLYEGPWLAERYTVVADLLARQPDAVHPVTRQVIERAQAFTAADAFRARHRLQALARQVETLMEGLAGLLVPSVPGHPTLDAVATDPVGENARLGTYTNFVNLLDMCAATVPTAPDAAGRPGSVTVIAPEGADHVVAALGERIHAAFAAPARRIAPHVSPVPGETAIAVVGAHMSGLPLNHELTSRGGRFLRAAATAPAYRLHALAGGPPKRPGLVRVETGGASIALEIWALPDEAVGAFLAGVPAPLAIGTVHLADGGAVKGFLCEAAGLAGAEDVTGHGGWRAYLAAGGAA